MKHELKLEFPTAKNYIPIARLSTTFVASLIDLDLDTIEDLRLIITEACNLCYFLQCDQTISLKIKVDKGDFYFKISSVDERKIKEDDRMQMSEAIITSLSDQVSYEGEKMLIFKRISG